MKQITLENGMIKGTDIVPEKIGNTEKIYVPLRENCFFGGFVDFTPRKFNSCIEDRLSILRLCDKYNDEDKGYSQVNAFAKARRNSKKYHKSGTFTKYYYAFINFYKVEEGEK